MDLKFASATTPPVRKAGQPGARRHGAYPVAAYENGAAAHVRELTAWNWITSDLVCLSTLLSRHPDGLRRIEINTVARPV
jgi:hypothetical protein